MNMTFTLLDVLSVCFIRLADGTGQPHPFSQRNRLLLYTLASREEASDSRWVRNFYFSCAHLPNPASWSLIPGCQPHKGRLFSFLVDSDLACTLLVACFVQEDVSKKMNMLSIEVSKPGYFSADVRKATRVPTVVAVVCHLFPPFANLLCS
jgi:hypothetical protein